MSRQYGTAASVDYSGNCTYVGAGRVKFFLKDDTNNAAAASEYIVKINNIPAPFDKVDFIDFT